MSGHVTATRRIGLAADPYRCLENLPQIGCCEVPDAHLLEWGGKFLLYRPAAGVVELTSDRPAADIGTTRFPGFDPTPLSLTLAVHRNCGLCCSYCYGVPDKHRTTSSLSREAVAWAAASVVRNCRTRHMPLQVNFHGDNEPLSRPKLLKGYIETVRKVADDVAVDLRLACTTSGLVPTETAHWAARNFDSLTLSHDGPSPLHDMQRPTCSGKPSSREVERTLSIFASENRRGELTIRSTITRHNEKQQSAMVDYFLDHFAIDRLAFYPVYPSPHRNGDRGLAVDSETFVRHFLAARQRARTKGVDLEYAGSRAPQRHSRHCTLLQRNLMLTPDGDATVCFMALDSRRRWDRQRLFGGWNASGEYPLSAIPDHPRSVLKWGASGLMFRKHFSILPYDRHRQEATFAEDGSGIW